MNIRVKILQTLFILLFASTSSCNVKTTSEQTIMEEDNDTTYLLGGYLINPTKKQVSLYEMTGGAMPNGGHWDGYRYVPSDIINYDSTTLYIVGNQIFFKEEMDFFPELDLNSLRIIHSDIDGYIDFFACDKNHLYKNAIGTPADDIRYMKPLRTINLSDYKMINDRIYQKGRDLYFLAMDTDLMQFELEKIENVTLHTPTLKHLTKRYVADKNGLYLLNGYWFWVSEDDYDGYYTSIQLEKSNGKTITPVLNPNYFIYGNKVYSTHSNYEKALPLNAEKIKELIVDDFYQVYLLADDNHVFKAEGYGGYDTDSNLDKSEFFSKNVNQWQVISVNEYFVKEQNFVMIDGITLYLPSAIKRFEGSSHNDEGMENNRTLVKTPNGFYSFLGTFAHTVEKIGKVFIFNFDTKEYEELDASQYRYVSRYFRIYKNRVYGSDDLPIKEPIDAENLHFITHHGKRTNYMTDGKLLIYKWGSGITEGEGINKMQILGEQHAISGVDFSTLKVITEDILIDKNNIYNGDGGIGIIPIKALNLDVKIFTE